ncbi:MAG: Trm112 family protein [Aquificaceae bacterium]|nr:Trm112 family protein [Aquificaceae bacterium]MDW8237558.1 Trm112 family protein [Aquificaceae bacterium]
MLSQELLSILACPICKGDLSYSPSPERLICQSCGVYYPFIDGIPILLPERAIPLESFSEYNQT